MAENEKELDALEQSQALNNVLVDLLKQQKQQNKVIAIALILSLIFNFCIILSFVYYESQFDVTSTETLTVTQDTGEGSGNNVYQAGEHASYNQGGDMNGETNSAGN